MIKNDEISIRNEIPKEYFDTCIVGERAKEIWFPYLHKLIVDRYNARVNNFDELIDYYHTLKGNFKSHKKKYRFIIDLHKNLTGILTKFVLEYFVNQNKVARKSEIHNAFRQKYKDDVVVKKNRSISSEIYSILNNMVAVGLIQKHLIIDKRNFKDKDNKKYLVGFYIAPFAERKDIEEAIAQYYN